MDSPEVAARNEKEEEDHYTQFFFVNPNWGEMGQNKVAPLQIASLIYQSSYVCLRMKLEDLENVGFGSWDRGY